MKNIFIPSVIPLFAQIFSLLNFHCSVIGLLFGEEVWRLLRRFRKLNTGGFTMVGGVTDL